MFCCFAEDYLWTLSCFLWVHFLVAYLSLSFPLFACIPVFTSHIMHIIAWFWYLFILLSPYQYSTTCKGIELYSYPTKTPIGHGFHDRAVTFDQPFGIFSALSFISEDDPMESTCIKADTGVLSKVDETGIYEMRRFRRSSIICISPSSHESFGGDRVPLCVVESREVLMSSSAGSECVRRLVSAWALASEYKWIGRVENNYYSPFLWIKLISLNPKYRNEVDNKLLPL